MKRTVSQSPEQQRPAEPRVWRSAGHPPRPAAGEPDPNRRPREIGGRKDGLDPTRYGDWEKNGRCIDF